MFAIARKIGFSYEFYNGDTYIRYGDTYAVLDPDPNNAKPYTTRARAENALKHLAKKTSLVGWTVVDLNTFNQTTSEETSKSKQKLALQNQVTRLVQKLDGQNHDYTEVELSMFQELGRGEYDEDDINPIALHMFKNLYEKHFPTRRPKRS